MFIRKKDKVYADLADKHKITRRLARKVAHHPFDVLHRIAYDPLNHRPLRLRYLGVFYVNPTKKKGMKYPTKDGYPEENMPIYARVKLPRPSGVGHGTYLHKGIIKEGMFISEDGTVETELANVYYWVYREGLIE
jgi:hypothetical protein